jgi:predicted GNAT family acetyltransferase
MDVETGRRAADFLAAAGPWVARDPVRHNVMATVSAGAALIDAELQWAVARENGTVVGAAVCTPPRAALLTTMPAPAAATIAEEFAMAAFGPTGASGGPDEVEAFGDSWTAVTGEKVTARTPLGIYRADSVQAPADVPGAVRPAAESDVSLLTGWVSEFLAELHHSERHPDPQALLRSRMEGNRLRLWEADGRPVAMASTSPPVDGVSRVSLVYTPPAERGHGYAAAVTAAVTQQELDAGARACMLYTERANATANRVYQRIGYVDLGDHIEVRFG